MMTRIPPPYHLNDSKENVPSSSRHQGICSITRRPHSQGSHIIPHAFFAAYNFWGVVVILFRKPIMRHLFASVGGQRADILQNGIYLNSPGIHNMWDDLEIALLVIQKRSSTTQLIEVQLPRRSIQNQLFDVAVQVPRRTRRRC